MSLHTDGTQVNLPSDTIWPGIVDPSLRKKYDVAIPGGKRIFLSDYSGKGDISLPQQGGPRDAALLASKLGDSHIFENNKILTQHLYNPDQESVPNTKLLSIRDWRRG